MTNGPPSESGDMRSSTNSTGHVEEELIHQALQTLKKRFKNRNSVQKLLGTKEAALFAATLNDSTDEYNPGIIPFHVTKHILGYLPTPCVIDNDDDYDEENAAKKKSVAKNIGESSRFLGIQGDGRSSSTSITPTDHIEMDPDFASMFAPDDLRLLALVSHNNMKQSMKQFVIANKNVLKKFRLTGTNTTMSMLKEVFGDDPEVAYGPKCKSGPLGGDAQLVAMAVTGQLGGCIFFIDPMDAHPHSADIECLVRQGNVHNILMMNNPTTAHICLNSLRVALKMGRIEMMPSFFFDLESPSVEAYKMRQNQVLQSTIDANTPALSPPSSLIQSAKNFVTAPSSVLKSSIREKKILEAMERANRLSIAHMKTRKSFCAGMEELNASGSRDAEDFLPANSDKEKEEAEASVPDGKKKKKKKKFFGVF